MFSSTLARGSHVVAIDAGPMPIKPSDGRTWV